MKLPKGMRDETAIEKNIRLLEEIEAKYGIAPEGTHEHESVAKLDRLLTAIEQSADHPDHVAKRDAPEHDVLWKVSPRHIRELAQRLNIDPSSPTALADLRKEVNARPGFVDAFLSEPLPAKTMGAGAAIAFSPEKIQKLAQSQGRAGQSVDDFRKAMEACAQEGENQRRRAK
jgi:hypothetical protein